MNRFIALFFLISLSPPLDATTFAPQTDAEIFNEAEILCAVEIGSLQFILKNNQVFSRAPLKPLECFVGDLPTNAVLEWPGGKQSFTHENGTTETITTQIPGLPIISKGDLKILSLTQDQSANLPLFNLKSWTYMPSLEKNSEGKMLVLEKGVSGSFLPSPSKAGEDQNTSSRSKKFRPQILKKNFAEYRLMVAKERKSKP